MATKINKLLLVRKTVSKSTLLDVIGASKFVQGDPLNVSPQAWHEEAGISHYGYILKDMSLKDLSEIDKSIRKNNPHEAITIHNFDPNAAEPVKEALESVGLRINESAE